MLSAVVSQCGGDVGVAAQAEQADRGFAQGSPCPGSVGPDRGVVLAVGDVADPVQPLLPETTDQDHRRFTWGRQHQPGPTPRSAWRLPSTCSGAGRGVRESVRRLDPAWGSLAAGKQAADDTFHFTYCCPQICAFNQHLWQGIENYALVNASTEKKRITVITGPVFGDGDPKYRNVSVARAF